MRGNQDSHSLISCANEVFEKYGENQSVLAERQKEFQDKIDCQLLLLSPLVVEFFNKGEHLQVATSKMFGFYRSSEDENLPDQVYLAPYIKISESGHLSICLKHPVDFNIFIEENSLYQEKKIFALKINANDKYFSMVKKPKMDYKTFISIEELSKDFFSFITASFLSEVLKNA